MSISATVATVIAAGALASAPESAAATNADVALAAAGPAPSCVYYQEEPPGIVTQTVRIYNDCTAGYYLKVDVAFSIGADSDCVYLPPFARRNVTVAYPDSDIFGITGVETCDGPL